MAITRQNPRTIFLGPSVEIEDHVASAAITPGALIERFLSSGTLKVRNHSTAAGYGTRMFALDRPELNASYTTAYAADDLVKMIVAKPGDVIYALIPSGHAIAAGAFLESNGDGALRTFGSGTRIGQALEAVANGAGLTPARCRVEVVS